MRLPAAALLLLILSACSNDSPDTTRPAILRPYVPVAAGIQPPGDFAEFDSWFRQHEQVDFRETLDGNSAIDPVLLWESYERARQLVATLFPAVPRYPMSVFDWEYLLDADPWENPNMHLDEAPAAIVPSPDGPELVQGQFVYSTASPPRRVPEIRYAHERAVFCEALHGILWIAWQEGRIGSQHFLPAGHLEPGDPFAFGCPEATNQEWLDSGVSAVPPLVERWPW